MTEKTSKISAAQVKTLRDMTGEPMMRCKEALVACQGDIEEAVNHLRKQGLKHALKKSDREAKEGEVFVSLSDDKCFAAFIEINCETDFVSRNEDFQVIAKQLSAILIEHKPKDLEAFLKLSMDDQGTTVETFRQACVGKLGENIQIRRIAFMASDAALSMYRHGNKIGVVVQLDKADDQLGRDVAMHIAAMHPRAVDIDDLPADYVASEKAIYMEQAKASGKPDDIIEKMIQGKLQKTLKAHTLINQPFVKDQEKTVGQVAKQANNKVKSFLRFELGEAL
jgi:elongation factor Ts